MEKIVCLSITRNSIEDDRLHGSKYYTSFDLRSGYYQILVTEESRQYTAFVIPQAQYKFTRMPFGFNNASNIFQRLMNRVLGPTKEIAAVYLSDVLIHTDYPKGCRQVRNRFRIEDISSQCAVLLNVLINLY